MSSNASSGNSIDIHGLLRLLSLPRIGPQKIRSLISFFGSPSGVFRASPQQLLRVPGIYEEHAHNIFHRTDDEQFADAQLQLTVKQGIHIVSLWDNDYPELLSKIYDPPVLLFIKGSMLESDQKSIAVVGTRHPSPYGRSTAERFSRDLVQHGICVVSGLARGIDTTAHSAALQSGGRTISVIGSGLDVPYPPENRLLMERIAESGAVVSEFPMGTIPDPANFPRRNRVISGLSLGTVVIESAETGGALITAAMALDQNREVFAVPGNITELRSSGTNKLIRDGRAKLISSVNDIFSEIQVQLHFPFNEKAEAQPPSFSIQKRVLFDILSSQPQHIDELADQTRQATSDTLVILLSLECKNLVRQLPGKYFIRA
ncbi:MAG: DNA-processing protein DprA [Bacteroidota bacterium]